MVTIAGFAGNRGRNLLNLDDLEPGGAQLGVIVTNHADAPIIESAATRGIPTVVVERDDGEDREDHEERILDELSSHSFDLVCLDGYMRILSGWMLEQLPITLNVHPSLLPLFPGMDAWGDALDAGVQVSGCTVHVVTDVVDEGPIVTQEPVPVQPEDTVSSLKRRILYEGEFKAYPRAVRWFAQDRVDVSGDRSSVDIDPFEGNLPEVDIVSGDQASSLRYGENPHQRAGVYVDPTRDEASVAGATQLNPNAKALSYNNVNDADAAYRGVLEFDDIACTVIKHANPAGAALGETPAAAYEAALSTDPMSAFGGIVALNRACDAETASAVTDSFKETVIAPTFTDDAVAVLRESDSIRVLEVPHTDRERSLQRRSVLGGHLAQDPDMDVVTETDLEVVTEREPTAEQLSSMTFGWRVAKHAASNAIVLVDGTETVGIGQGQVSRVDAVHLAIRKGREHAEGKDPEGSVLVSDGFFPFADGIELAAEAGITAVVQPGGSRNDESVIEAANEHDIAMAFTGRRCFRH